MISATDFRLFFFLFQGTVKYICAIVSSSRRDTERHASGNQAAGGRVAGPRRHCHVGQSAPQQGQLFSRRAGPLRPQLHDEGSAAVDIGRARDRVAEIAFQR